MRRILALLTLVVGLTTVAGAFAEDMSGAPMVRRKITWRTGRSELRPSLAWTVNDRYFNNFIIGLGYNYHFLDWLAAGANVGWAFPIKTSLADSVEEQKKTDTFSFPIPASHFGLLADAHVELSPGTGKFMLWNQIAVAYDFHAILGIGTVQVRWNSDAEARFGGQEEDAGGFKLSPKVGLGMRVFLDRGIALTVEVVDHMAYMYKAAEVTADGKHYTFPKEDPEFCHNLAAVLGFSIMMPFETGYEE